MKNSYVIFVKYCRAAGYEKTVVVLLVCTKGASQQAVCNASRRQGEENMGRKLNKPIIESVEYTYAGTDKQFNEFLRAVIHDYISADSALPDCDCTVEAEPQKHEEEKIA